MNEVRVCQAEVAPNDSNTAAANLKEAMLSIQNWLIE
jgi:hypothetical protein